MNTIDDVLTLAVQHKWIPFAAVIIGGVVRVLKSDSPIYDVPARWRPWLALALGAVAGVLQAVMGGATWTKALVDGLSAALIAIAGHDLGVESLRAGKEPFGGSSSQPPPPPARPASPPPLPASPTANGAWSE